MNVTQIAKHAHWMTWLVLAGSLEEKHAHVVAFNSTRLQYR